MKRCFFILTGIILACMAVATAQITNEPESESIMMTGQFSEKQATGIYVKGADENINLNWSVFLGNDGKVYKINVTESKITQLFVDGEKVPNENISNYAAETKPFLDNLAIQAEIEKLEKEIDAKAEDIDQQTNEIDKISNRIDKATEKIDDWQQNRSVDLSVERGNLSKLRAKNSELRDSISAKRDALSLQRDKLSEKRDSLDTMKELDRVLNKIISDLKAEGIIKNSNKLSFKLSNREFIVNGKRLSAEIHQKLKAKYVIETAFEAGFLYRWKEKI